MIDRETAVQWAMDAGCNIAFGSKMFNPEYFCGSFSVHQLQDLITKVQNKAYEQAAEITDEGLGDNNLSKKIRALKQTNGETNAKR